MLCTKYNKLKLLILENSRIVTKWFNIEYISFLVFLTMTYEILCFEWNLKIGRLNGITFWCCYSLNCWYSCSMYIYYNFAIVAMISHHFRLRVVQYVSDIFFWIYNLCLACFAKWYLHIVYIKGIKIVKILYKSVCWKINICFLSLCCLFCKQDAFACIRIWTLSTANTFNSVLTFDELLIVWRLHYCKT